ncbi:unnamed protein product, partial [Ostreobium quekettii]
TDIYSLGVVMWECLTGKKPQPLSWSLQSAAGHDVDVADPSHRCPQAAWFPLDSGHPAAMRDLVWRCLSCGCNERPECEEVASLLAELSMSDRTQTGAGTDVAVDVSD